MIDVIINDWEGKRHFQAYAAGDLKIITARSPEEAEAVLLGLNKTAEILNETKGDRELLRRFLAVLDEEMLTGDFRDRHPRPCYCAEITRSVMFNYLSSMLRREARG
jgi:hypothetical protein